MTLADTQKECLRAMPALSSLLEMPEAVEAVHRYGAGTLKLILREQLDALRQEILSASRSTLPSDEAIMHKALLALERFGSPQGRRAVNAAGIILHTGLGRAPLCDRAVDALSAMNTYSVLQTDIESGERSLREAKIEKMLAVLTGCESATIVNNNAAATMLILNTLCKNKEAIVSRGQLVEIGGAFRIPDVMEQSGAVLREVGCTNKTHVADYARACNENTGAFLHVHTSNYRIRGFASMPRIDELCALRDEKFPHLPVIDDLGSGALVHLSDFGMPDEPLIADSIRAGADICSFSGDKLICGPQCGIICGKKAWIEKIRKNPYMRMFRVCKLTLAAMESTLLEFLNGTYAENLPLYRMLSRTENEMREQAAEILDNTADILDILNLKPEIATSVSYIGSGSVPDEGLPSIVLKLERQDGAPALNTLAKRLRQYMPPVFARIENEALIFDMRTLFESDTECVICALRALSV